MTRRRNGEAGAGTVVSLIALVVGGFVTLVVIVLFATGLAQREILTRLRASMSSVTEQVVKKVKREAPEKDVAAARADSAAVAADSLEALRAQIETQKAFLEEQKRDLARLRGSVDSLVTSHETGQNRELARQAKLLAGMKPEEAARILEQMDDGTVSVLLSRLNPRVASRVLPKLDAARVARLATAAIGAGEMDAVIGDQPGVSSDAAQ